MRIKLVGTMIYLVGDTPVGRIPLQALKVSDGTEYHLCHYPGFNELCGGITRRPKRGDKVQIIGEYLGENYVLTTHVKRLYGNNLSD